MSNDPIIKCQDVHKWYGDFHVLRGVNMNVRKGEVVVVFGPSGSGKSTFIRCINRLEEHQKGHIIVDGIELSHDVRNIAAIRKEVGMVFQQFNLFPHLTVMQNITLGPIYVRKWDKEKAEAIAIKLLKRVGIPEQAKKYPGQLSGGQQQRVAVARALASQPKFVIADEPTANLDSKSTNELLDIMAEMNRKYNTTFIFATHDKRVMDKAGRIITIDDGKVVNDEKFV
jgi:general L-amino acid transport system ATP-binding protein